MSTPLHEFVSAALAKQIPREEIREALLKAGWQADEIKTALAAYAEEPFPIPVPKRKPYLSAREAFEYLILFLTLYISSFSFGTIIFQSINRWIPDAVEGRYSYEYQGSLEAVRSATAALVITFPVFLLLSWLIARAKKSNAENRSSKIRKWLTYITLFIAAGVIIGDLIALVSSVLSGELTTRFVLKVLTVLVIAAAIFGYYLWDLRREETLKQETRDKKQETEGRTVPVLTIIVTIAAIAAAVTGFVISGSPSRERARRFDEMRIQDLIQITSAIDWYWNQNKKLPATLSETQAWPGPSAGNLRDPETNEAYEYRMKDAATYELCATFRTSQDATKQPTDRPIYRGDSRWDHPQGRSCFTLRANSSVVPPPKP